MDFNNISDNDQRTYIKARFDEANLSLEPCAGGFNHIPVSRPSGLPEGLKRINGFTGPGARCHPIRGRMKNIRKATLIVRKGHREAYPDGIK